MRSRNSLVVGGKIEWSIANPIEGGAVVGLVQDGSGGW